MGLSARRLARMDAVRRPAASLCLALCGALAATCARGPGDARSPQTRSPQTRDLSPRDTAPRSLQPDARARDALDPRFVPPDAAGSEAGGPSRDPPSGPSDDGGPAAPPRLVARDGSRQREVALPPEVVHFEAGRDRGRMTGTEAETRGLTVVEDGSAAAAWGTVLGRGLDAPDFHAFASEPALPEAAPDAISPATERAAEALGWRDVASVRSFFDARADTASGLVVAVRLPRPPSYHSRNMALRAEIDRGDVWYDFPYDGTGRRLPQSVNRRARLVIYARDGAREVALVRWPTTIGGWEPELRPSWPRRAALQEQRGRAARVARPRGLARVAAAALDAGRGPGAPGRAARLENQS